MHIYLWQLGLQSILLKLCQQAGKSEATARIICHELESWFLGDFAAREEEAPITIMH